MTSDIVGANDYSVVSSLSISLDRIKGESEAALCVLFLLSFLSLLTPDSSKRWCTCPSLSPTMFLLLELRLGLKVACSYIMLLSLALVCLNLFSCPQLSKSSTPLSPPLPTLRLRFILGLNVHSSMCVMYL